MPKLELDYKFNIGSLINGAIILVGFIVSIALFYNDTKRDSVRLDALAKRVDALANTDQVITTKLAEAQERTTSRLSTLEAQNSFIIRALDRLETTLGSKPR